MPPRKQPIKLISWNVNGVRAAWEKGLRDFLHTTDADVVCLQETKALPEQVEHLDWPSGFQPFWNPADKKGYSGTLVLARTRPKSVTSGMNLPDHDSEGRVINAEFPRFTLVNVYTPNAQRELARLDYRVRQWDAAFREHVSALAEKKPVIFCGDLNVAHTEIDLANPKSNKRNAGFTLEERESFTETLAAGFIDTFREFEAGGGHYSWWSYRSNARERNIGWRIDYFCISKRLRPKLKDAFILPGIQGSDHCPVGMVLG